MHIKNANIASIWEMYVYACSFLFLFIVGMTPNLNVNVPGSSPTTPAATATLFAGAPNNLSALVSQHRLLELSRFGLRGYDLAQHMLTQQGAVSKLLGNLIKNIVKFILLCSYKFHPQKKNSKLIQKLNLFMQTNIKIFYWSFLSSPIPNCQAHKTDWNEWMIKRIPVDSLVQVLPLFLSFSIFTSHSFAKKEKKYRGKYKMHLLVDANITIRYFDEFFPVFEFPYSFNIVCEFHMCIHQDSNYNAKSW